MSAIVDAIDQELELVQRRIEQLRDLRAKAAELDGYGARTGPERRIIEAISSVQLTANEIAAGTKIPPAQCASILAGLVRRGAIEREDVGSKALFGLVEC